MLCHNIIRIYAHCLLEWGLESPTEAQDIPYACWILSRISHTSQSHKPSLHNLNNTEVANWKKNERCEAELYPLRLCCWKIYQQKLISFVKLHHHGYLLVWLQNLYCMSDSATSGTIFDAIYLANGNISICDSKLILITFLAFSIHVGWIMTQL